MRHAGEPSVEEILESIKKVIARDNRSEADQLRRRREQDGLVPGRAFRPEEMAVHIPDIDADPVPVLELTDAQLAPVVEIESANQGGTAMAEDESETVQGPAGPAQDEPAALPEAPLVAETARASMRESLAALAMLSEPGVPPQIVRSGETSLEALTRDLLRPMLAEWLDKNLPPMVDKLVATEISRIVGKRG